MPAVYISKELCDKNWNLTGVTQKISVSGLIMSSVNSFISGNTNDNSSWKVLLTGSLIFETFPASAVVTVVDQTSSLVIYFSINNYAGVNVNVTLPYKKAGEVAYGNGTARIYTDGVALGRNYLELNASAVYCSKPLTASNATIGSYYGYQFYISSYSSFSINLYHRDIRSPTLVLARRAHVVNYEVELQPWEFLLQGVAGFPETGKANQMGAVTVKLGENYIESFLMQFNTTFADQVTVNITVAMKEPEDCLPGDENWYGNGSVTVLAVPNFGDITTTCQWLMACDGTGRFVIYLDIDKGTITSFTALSMDFLVTDVDMTVAKASGSRELTMNITGKLSGIKNLVTTFHFNLPFSDESIYIEYDSLASALGGLLVYFFCTFFYYILNLFIGIKSWRNVSSARTTIW